MTGRTSIAKQAAKRGDKVWTYFDTGAFGAAILTGIVEAAGPLMFTVLWESGLRNRLRQDRTDVWHRDPTDGWDDK